MSEPITAEQIAVEHIMWRRRNGFTFADCRQEARVCLAAMGLRDRTLDVWDEVVEALAVVWEELPLHFVAPPTLR